MVAEDGSVTRHKVVDASTLFGLWYFQMLEQSDPLFTKSLQATTARLTNTTQLGGVIRYEQDPYFKDTDRSNPWFITTLWEVERRLAQETVTQEDVTAAEQVLAWVVAHQYPSGVLAEQLNPYTGESRSATPLAWSHAVYVEAILHLFQAKRKLGQLVEKPASEIDLHEL